MALCGGNPPLRSAPRRGAERASRTTRRAEGESGTARGDGQRWARRAERGNALCGGTPPLRSAPTARGGRGRLSCAVGEQAQPLRRVERGTGQRGARRGKAGLRGDGQRWARRAEGGNGLVRRQPSVKIGPAARRGEGEPDNAARGGGKRDCARGWAALGAACGGGNGLVRRQPSVKIGPAARHAEGEPDNAARGGGKRDCARGWVALGAACGGREWPCAAGTLLPRQRTAGGAGCAGASIDAADGSFYNR